MYKKFVDIIIIVGILLALFVGVITIKHYRETASKQIEATSEINFNVYLKGVMLSKDENPIKKDDTTFISIRNVPYTDLKVVDVEMSPKMVSVAGGNGGVSVIDASQPNTYDISVTVTDTAKITKDGAVVGGNKIKMGLPITLEGKTYKFTGTVSDIDIFSDRK